MRATSHVILRSPVHVADGILPASACVAAHVASYGGLYASGRNLRVEDASKMGLLAAASFVVSTIQFPLAGVSIHLGLYGLLGILLGPRAFPVLFASLLLQSLLFQHGGLLALGLNALNMGCGAMVGWAIWKISTVPEIPRAAAAGFLGTLLPAFLLAAEFELAAYGRGFYVIASAYAVVAVVEAFVTVGIITFLRKAKPEILQPATA